MLTIWATLCKELLELRRDRAGLMVLLVMPMALVLIVSLVQDNVMQATGEAPIRVLFVDRDNSFLGRGIERQLRSAGGVELVSTIKGRQVTEEGAREAVARGDFQFCVLIPPGTGTLLAERSRQAAAAAFVTPAPAATSPPSPGLTVLFDPAVQGTLRTAVGNALQRVMLAVELQEKGAIYADVVPREMKKAMVRMMGPGLALQTGGYTPEVRFRMDAEPALRLTEEAAFPSRLLKRPTAAQQNVPAWALFGMFFIVVPLSGSLLRERQSGTLLRLMTMPVSPLSLLAGKVFAYVLVCLAQLVLMLAVGMFVLPLLGTSGLSAGTELLAIAPIAISAALAATGYGIMVGTLAKSYDQASMFGSVSIVIAAALGGIMIPVYVMPRFMQKVSLVSPLAWGLNGFQDIFVRGGSVWTPLPEIASLLALFAVTITIAVVALHHRRSGE
jgi:ABC-2 type transport system permease protein